MSAAETETFLDGDFPDWLQRWDDASVDPIHLDPPINSKGNCEVLYPSGGVPMNETMHVEPPEFDVIRPSSKPRCAESGEDLRVDTKFEEVLVASPQPMTIRYVIAAKSNR